MKYSPISKRLNKAHYGNTMINWFLKGPEANCSYNLYLGHGEYHRGRFKTTREVWDSTHISDRVWEHITINSESSVRGISIKTIVL